jgi:hypothetical protein
LAAPGTYTVKLTVGEQELTQEILVKKDPSSAGTEQQVKDQVATLLEIRDHINTVVGMINTIEWTRKQLYDLEDMLKDNEDVAEILESGKALDVKLKELENRFFDLRLSGARQDTLWWPRRLYAKLGSLAGYIGSSDHPPTTQQMEILGLYRQQVSEYQAELQRLKDEDIAAFNELLNQKGMQGIISVAQ